MKTFSTNAILSITALIAVGTSAAKFDYTAIPAGSDKCALINIAMDESTSTRNERDFIIDTALPRIGRTLPIAPYNYDHVFVCSGSFAGEKSNGSDQYRHQGCTTIAPDGTINDLSVVTWAPHKGRFEDGWTGMWNAMRDVYDTIEGINLISTCGRIDKNLILLTDEDRDDRDGATENLTFDKVKQKIADNEYILNVIIAAKIANQFTNIGMIIKSEADGTHNNIIFQQDLQDPLGYSNYTDNQNYRTFTSGGLMRDHYADLVLNTPGAVWSLTALNKNTVADTFADVFVAKKVEEMNNCYSDCPSSAPSSAPSSSKGDPHFNTWKQEHFEFHGQCDMILAKDSNFANGIGLDVQIRTKIVRFWSYIHTAAIRIGNDILEIQGSPDTQDHEVHYWFNFEYQADANTIGGFPLTIRSDGGHKRFFEINLDSKFPGQTIVLSTFKEFVAVDFKGGTVESFGNTVGLLGDYKTGKTLARDGVTEINDFYEFGEEWQVLPSDPKLFREFTHPQFPESCIKPEDPRGDRKRRLAESTISVEQAESACAPLKDPLTIKDCVYDILATQDLDMVGAF